MKPDILVDTCVLIDAFRGNITREVSILKELDLREENYSIPAICAQEVLQGAKTQNNWNKLKSFLETYQLVVPRDPIQFHIDTAEIYFKCKKKGITIRSSIDCMVSQLAIEHNATLLTSDKDFQHIKKISALKIL